MKNLNLTTHLVMLLLLSSAIKVCAQNLYPFKNYENKWGYEDHKKTMVIPAQFKKAGHFSEGFAYVQNDKDKYAYINSKGDKITKFKYDFAVDFKNGLARVYTGESKTAKWGLIDKSGKEVIPLKYDYVSDFIEDLILVRINGKCGYIDLTGKEIIPLQYDAASDFNGGFTSVRIGGKESGKYGLIDKTGKEIVPAKYDASFDFHEGLAYVKLNGKYGFIDKTGKEVISLKYDDAYHFSEGLALAKLNGKYGYLDTTGKEVIPFIYDEAGSFVYGTARVTLKGEKFEIDKTGRSEEQEKKKAKEKEENARKDQQFIISLTRRDTLAKKVFDIYFEQDKLLFAKVNALNEYLRGSMPNTQAPIFNYQWPSIALEMKNNYCKNAKSQLDSYRAKFKEVVLTKGQNELYDKVRAYIENVAGFISSCDAWADFISNRPDDVKDVDKQLEYLETNQKAMKKSDNEIRQFIETYKKRNRI